MEQKKPTLALTMMVKNESKRIKYSLESVKDIVDKFIILDTGSHDSTQDIIRDFCKINNIELCGEIS